MKNVLISLLILMAIVVSLNGCEGRKPEDTNDSGKKDEINITPPEPTKQEVDKIKEEISGMTLDEKIGQMVISCLDGYIADSNAINMIVQYHIGGFIVLGENVKDTNQLLSLLNSLKEANAKSKFPLFLSVDEEGGRVSRMPREFVKFPASMTIGKKNDSKLSFNIGSAIAAEISSLGFNVDFAPVLDINSNPKNPVIGDRSFGTNPEIVSKLGIETMKGIQSRKVISVVKHFPGHGDTSVDSHIGLPKVDNSLSRLKSFELKPFQEAIKNGVDVVMAAHILLPQIDPEYPSSMSKTIITDLLRKDMGFSGVVITDDLTMGAIAKNYDIGDAAVKSVNAGCNIALVCHDNKNVLKVINSLKKAVQDGVISEDTIDDSVYRILKLKEKYKLSDNVIGSVDVNKVNSEVNKMLGSYLK